MRDLNENDKSKFLQHGNLTKPFLQDDFVLSQVMRDFDAKVKKGIENTLLESLFNWINYKVKFADEKFREKNRFKRTAQEIWESGLTTGCTDYAILFATFARQIGIPATFLHTAEEGWLNKLLNHEKCDIHYGHSFCECFYDGKWVLVDPTYRRIEKCYNPEKLELSYNVGPGNVYIPYFRGLDLCKRQSTQEHNHLMDKICSDLFSQKQN